MVKLHHVVFLALLGFAYPACAQVPISNLPAATTPPSGSEVFPVVQSGVTKKMPIGSLPNSGVTAGSYGDPTHCTSFVVAANGTLTGASQSTSCPGSGGGGGTVTTSGSPSAGQIAKFSGGTVITTAVAGTDYAAPTSGAAILFGNGSGGFSNVTIGSGLTFVGGTLQATGGGGGGSPGGTTGQVQYNNSGAFGGFTVNGDATINTTTGGITVTKTNGSSFVASATTDTTNASNISSGTLGSSRGGAGAVSGMLRANGSGAVTAVTIGSGLSFNGTTLSNTGPGTGTVTSVATGACLTGGTITTAGTLAGTYTVNAQTGTTYTVQSADACKLVTASNGSATAWTLPQATGSFGSGWSFDMQNKGAGTVTVTPTTSTVNGSASLAVATNRGCTFVSDGTNYQVGQCTALLP